MRYKRKRPAARRSSITGAARRGAALTGLSPRSSLARTFARSLARLASHAAADKPILAGHVYTRACDRIRNPWRGPRSLTYEPRARRVALRKSRASVSKMTKARRRTVEIREASRNNYASLVRLNQVKLKRYEAVLRRRLLALLNAYAERSKSRTRIKMRESGSN